MRKIAILMPIVMIVLAILTIIIFDIFGGGRSIRPELKILEPAGASISVEKGKTLYIEGEASSGGMVEFKLKDGAGKDVSAYESKRVDKDGSFKSEVLINTPPGKYVLTISLEPNILPHNIDVTVNAGGTPPYFVIDGNRQEGSVAFRGDVMVVKVKDDDGDLSRVLDKTFSGVGEYDLRIPSGSVVDKIQIDAVDLAGNTSPTLTIVKGVVDRRPPVFYVNDEPQPNGAKIILKDNTTIKVADDYIIEKIGDIAVNAPTHEFSASELRNLKEGTNKIVASDGVNTSNLTIVKESSVKDNTPPSFSVKSPLYLKPGDNLKVKFTDRSGLLKVGPIDVVGKDFTLDLQSDRLQYGDNQFDAVDIFGNKSTLTVVKINPPTARVVSVVPPIPPTAVATNKSKISIVVEVKDGYGKKVVKLNEESKDADMESGRASFDNIALKEGLNKITISAKDETGIVELKPLEITVDTKPPEIVSVDGRSVGEQIWMLKRLGSNLAHVVTVKDESGIDRVMVNKENVKIDIGAGDNRQVTVSIPDRILPDKKDDSNRLIFRDKAGNEASKPIKIVAPDKDVEAILKELNALLKQGDYERASELVKEFEKQQPGRPTPNLYKGIINHEKGRYQEAISDLTRAYNLREMYDPNTKNLEYNLCYLGMALYETWKVNKNNSLWSDALNYTNQFLSIPGVEKKVPEDLYARARAVMNGLTAKK